ncbi:juvenile hormone esterase-like isoform X2 [Daktulosphaira vitifoliae]|uniref:juvenile hormone esterase-like isoform X2 n=1 Tax=Daktulosphaira vitifoliae TaxID=58002 RepID=UPI0021AAD843|nr:juvenile hormone esterase-like isoform X2 [Daktulosphaira vitifoliae]
MIQIFLLGFIFVNFASSELTVKTSKGVLKGEVLISRNGREFDSFMSIPYAKPPVGELRFKAPVPVDPWSGVLDATKEPTPCIQEPAGFNTSENCLFLNVYTPHTDKTNLPVMVYIHGGAFLSGHSGPTYAGAKYFMDKDVVLVTTNYRVGILGFITFEDDRLPGNQGLKDQALALKWVKENIRYFNGDPGKVTLFGQSAGSASVGLHLLSPMSKGLFHRAILESGSPLALWAVAPPGFGRKKGEHFAKLAGCHSNNTASMMKCLQNISDEKIVEIQRSLVIWRNHPLIYATPTVENCDAGQKAFICEHPLRKFKVESDVPIIVGSNTGEGGIIVASLYNKTDLLFPELDQNFTNLIAMMTFYEDYSTLPSIKEIGIKLLKEYFPSGRISGATHLNSVKLFTDAIFTYAIMDLAHKWTSPAYVYLYNYQNEFSFNTRWGSCEIPLGVSHNDELTSLFNMGNNAPDLNPADTAVSKIVIDIWTQFATTGNPTINGKENGSEWPKYDPTKDSIILNISSVTPELVEDPFKNISNMY